MTDAYLSWPSIEELSSFKPTLGILENRGESLIRIDLDVLKSDMGAYLDPNLSWHDLVRKSIGLTRDAARYDARATRARVLEESGNRQGQYLPILLRPMDKRWCFYSHIRPLWNEPRPSYVRQCWDGNEFIVTRRKGVARIEGSPFNWDAYQKTP